MFKGSRKRTYPLVRYSIFRRKKNSMGNSDTEKTKRRMLRMRASDPERYRALMMGRRARYIARYPEKHKETKARSNARWVAKNPEKVAAYAAKWGPIFKALRAAAAALRPKPSAEELAAKKKEARWISKQARRAKKRGNGGKLTRGYRKRLFELQKSKCAVCATDVSKSYHFDHIIPLALGGLNEDGNMQILCPPCNQDKHAKHPVDFMQSRGYLI